MARRPVRQYIEGTPPLPAPSGGVPSQSYGGVDEELAQLWAFYLAPELFIPYEPAAPTPEPEATLAPPPLPALEQPPSTFQPPPSLQEPSRPSPAPEPLASPTAPATAEPLPALVPLPSSPAESADVDPSLVLLGAREGSYRAAQEAERAARIAELEAETELRRLMDREALAREQAEKLLKSDVPMPTPDDRAMREAFENIGKAQPTPASVDQVAELGRTAQVGRALGKVARVLDELGPLGVMLPPVFWPDDRAFEAQRNIDREANERRARERRLERLKSRRAPRQAPAAPPPPPPVPRLPGLSDDELADVLGERQSTPAPSAKPRKPASTRPASTPKTAPLPPSVSATTTAPDGGGAQSTTSPTPWWQTVLEDAAQAGWEVIYRELVPRKRKRRPTTTPAESTATPSGSTEKSARPSAGSERSTPDEQLEPSNRPGEPEASARPAPRARPLPELAPLPSAPSSDCPPCKTRRRPRRPSDKVPTVRAYKRRMSQNSLDNLKRGRGRKE